RCRARSRRPRANRLRRPVRLRCRRQRVHPRVPPLRRSPSRPDRRQPAGTGGRGGDRHRCSPRRARPQRIRETGASVRRHGCREGSDMKAAAAATLAALLLTAAASAGDRSLSGGTPAAAPFAPASASVTKTTEGRKAPKIVVFGVANDVVGGFNTALSCCNSLAAVWLGFAEALRGAFVQNEKGVWVKDLVTSASATKTSLSYTISPK